MNNPLNGIDINGDSTRYVNKRGQTLLLSKDNLPNAVSVVTNKNMKTFMSMLNDAKGKKDFNANSKDLNKSLRTQCVNYMTKGLNQLYQKSISAGKTSSQENILNPKTLNPIKLYPETGAKLVATGNSVEVGKNIATGSGKGIHYNSESGNVVGDAHSHPNEGTYVAIDRGYGVVGGVLPTDTPSEIDNLHNPSNGYFNVISGKSNFTFINQTNQFSIPKTFNE